MYKVGDEVLVNGTVENVEDYGAFVYVCGMGKAFFNKKELIPANKTYEQGSADAWKLAKKIQYSLTRAQLEEIFGTDNESRIMDTHTPEEALAKIEAYEKEKEIKVGDVVKLKHTEWLGIVTNSENESDYVMWKNGTCGCYENRLLEKTGRTAKGLTDLLRQIGE